MSPFIDIPVSEILPQREPFVFVDRLVHYDERETVTEFTVRPDQLLVADGYLTAPGILENMAQSSAARIGYLCKFVRHVPVRIGYIGAIKKFRVYRLPAVGETLTTTIFFREDVFGISLVDAVVRVGDDMIAEAALKTTLGEKEAE